MGPALKAAKPPPYLVKIKIAYSPPKIVYLSCFGYAGRPASPGKACGLFKLSARKPAKALGLAEPVGYTELSPSPDPLCNPIDALYPSRFVHTCATISAFGKRLARLYPYDPCGCNCCIYTFCRSILPDLPTEFRILFSSAELRWSAINGRSHFSSMLPRICLVHLWYVWLWHHTSGLLCLWFHMKKGNKLLKQQHEER